MNISRRPTLPRLMLTLGLAGLLAAACAPQHPGGELVETGRLKAETKGTNEFQVNKAWVHVDAEGTHIHGEVSRKNSTYDRGHVDVSLLDAKGVILYQSTMKPSRWSTLATSPKNPTPVNIVRSETFHVVTSVPPPENGTVRVIFHPGPEHEMK